MFEKNLIRRDDAGVEKKCAGIDFQEQRGCAEMQQLQRHETAVWCNEDVEVSSGSEAEKSEVQ